MRGCRCEGCAEKRRAYYEANREEIAEKQRAYYEANREKIAEKQRAYYEANREEIAEKRRAYYEANREEIAEKQRAYYEANREKIAEKQRAYYEANREKIAEKQRAYYEAHPELRIYYREHARRRAKGLPTRGLMDELRRNGLLNTPAGAEWTAIEQAIARGTSTGQIMTDLGVKYDTVRTVREAMDGVA